MNRPFFLLPCPAAANGYNPLDRISEVWYNNGVNGAMKLNYSYAYDSNNFLHSLTDHIADQVTVYTYDTYGNPDRTYTYDSETYKNLYEVNVAVSPTENRMEFVLERLDYTHTAGFGTVETTYDYVYSYATGKLNRVQIGGSKLWGYLTPTYDNFGRTTSHVADLQLSGSTTFYSKVDYEYEQTWDDTETYRVSYMANTIGKTLSTAHVNAYCYEYDDLGNITRILNDNATTLYQYTYDDLGQLVREDNYDKGYSYTYTYDFAGNLLSKKTYAFSTGTLGAVISTRNFTYGDSGWGDLLTHDGYEGIGYDGIGNPIVIGTRDSTNSYWNCGVELDWDGRQLKSYQYFLADEDERYYENSFFYQYNADGIRTSKTVDGIEHKYYLNGSQILAETWKQGSTEHLVIFVYDENGSPIALKYRTNAYAENTFDFFFYEKNLQGDIIGIFNTNGRRVGWYIYDAWGVCSTYVASSTSSLEQSIVRSYNPYRYRGYYYDTETQLYYLQSRYYNPAWGRFLNADDSTLLEEYTDFVDFNLFSYCLNDPINRIDTMGYWSWKNILQETLMVTSIVAITVAASALVVATAGVAAPVLAGVGVSVVSATAATTTMTSIALTSTYVAGTCIVANSAIELASDCSNSINYAKAGDGIGEHTNGTKNWDKHSKKRAGGKEKKDTRMKPRQNKKKRNIR